MLDLVDSEVLWVELEVLVIVPCAVLVSPLNVGPYHIKRVSKSSEVSIPFHKNLSRYICVLAKGVSESLDHWHGSKSCDCSEIIVHVFDAIEWAMFLGRASEYEEFKCTR